MYECLFFLNTKMEKLKAIDLQEYLHNFLFRFKYLPMQTRRSLKLMKKLDKELEVLTK